MGRAALREATSSQKRKKGYQPPTFALPTPYLRRFMFGFRLKAKPEDALELVGRR